jgi:hypothetical protein
MYWYARESSGPTQSVESEVGRRGSARERERRRLTSFRENVLSHWEHGNFWPEALPRGAGAISRVEVGEGGGAPVSRLLRGRSRPSERVFLASYYCASLSAVFVPVGSRAGVGAGFRGVEERAFDSLEIFTFSKAIAVSDLLSRGEFRPRRNSPKDRDRVRWQQVKIAIVVKGYDNMQNSTPRIQEAVLT